MADRDAPVPPEDGAQRVGQALGALARVDRSATFLEAGGASFSISHPLPIYALGNPDAGSTPETILGRTTLVGWRYLANGLSVLVDIRLTGPKRPEILRGADVANRFVRAVTLAESECPDPSRCDIRLLDLNQLGRIVIWLHAEQKEQFFSFSTPPRELEVTSILMEVSTAERIKARAHANTSSEAGG